MENGFIESFNGKFRDECLNENCGCARMAPPFEAAPSGGERVVTGVALGEPETAESLIIRGLKMGGRSVSIPAERTVRRSSKTFQQE
jgi:hypothetical protein